jgi:hypothetical protein
MCRALALIAALIVPGASTAAPSLLYYTFSPTVSVVGQTTPVTLRAVIEGDPSSVELATAAGPVLPLALVDVDTYQLTLTSAQVLDGYSEGDAHNFVGFLDVYDGATRDHHINIFANVRDSTMPDITVSQIAPDVQVGPHVVNIRRDTLWLSGSAPQDVLLRFYELFEDDFDFIAVVSQVRTVRNRTYTGVRNDVTGIGLSIFDFGATYGSQNQLQGIINFPIDSFFDLAETAAIHEIGHRWMCFLDNPQFSQSPSHWPISDVAYGVMGFNIPGSNNVGGSFAWELIEQPNGDYLVQRRERAREFNGLELYLMGMASTNEIADTIVFQDQDQGDQLFHGGVLHGPVDVITIDDIITANGPRVPGEGNSQAQFRMASIILSANSLLNVDEMAFFDHMSARGEATSELPFTSGFSSGTTKPFFLATDGRATLSTDLPEPGSLLMLGSGAILLNRLYRRRMKSKFADTVNRHPN